MDSESDSMVCGEEEDRRINEWEYVGKGKIVKSQKRKKKETSGIGESESELRKERKE